VIITLLMTVMVFSFVLMLGEVIKEVLMLLINQKVGFLTVIRAIALLVPHVLVFSLPMGMLAATLLIFGRLSADQELIAIRSSGVSLMAIITPIILVSVALSVVCAMINLEIAPRCRVAYKGILYKVKYQVLDGDSLQGDSLLAEGLFTQIKDYSLYVGESLGDNCFRDVECFRLDSEKSKDLHVSAKTMEVKMTEEGYVLRFKNGSIIDNTTGKLTPSTFDEWSTDPIIKPSRARNHQYPEKENLESKRCNGALTQGAYPMPSPRL